MAGKGRILRKACKHWTEETQKQQDTPIWI